MIQAPDYKPVLERIAAAFERIAKVLEDVETEGRERAVPASEVTRIPPPRVNRPQR